jgi:hypothetical protein
MDSMDPYTRVIVKLRYINAADMYISCYGDGVYATGTPYVEAAADSVTSRRVMYEEATEMAAAIGSILDMFQA